jgi:ribosome recycling factor
MIDDLITDAARRMDKTIETTQQEFNGVRTGRASAALLDHVAIDYYGSATPLKQLATINVPEARMLTIQPFDPSSWSRISASRRRTTAR